MISIGVFDISNYLIETVYSCYFIHRHLVFMPIPDKASIFN